MRPTQPSNDTVPAITRTGPPIVRPLTPFSSRSRLTTEAVAVRIAGRGRSETAQKAHPQTRRHIPENPAAKASSEEFVQSVQPCRAEPHLACKPERDLLR